VTTRVKSSKVPPGVQIPPRPLTVFKNIIVGTMDSKTIKLLDTLWQKCVKKKSNNKCFVCYDKGTESHHLIRRQHMATRWELLNGICLCSHHHRLATDGKIKFLIDNNLKQLSKQIKKWTAEEIELKKKELMEYLKWNST
jgi:predicted restriction endonuclease